MFFSCFKAEMVKLRKSWPLLVSILAPICVTGFLAVLVWYSDAVVVRFFPGCRFWIELNFVVWNLFALPVLAAIISELSWAQDRDASIWRHLLHQPMSKTRQYLAKLTAHLVLILSSVILLFLLILFCGWILQHNEALRMGSLIRPNPPYFGVLPIVIYLRYFAFSIVALIPVVTFATWFSFRLPGPGIALGVALVGTWGAMKLVGITFLVQFLPWGLSGHAAEAFERYRFALPWNYCYGSMALAIFLIIIGSLDFNKYAYVKSLERN